MTLFIMSGEAERTGFELAVKKKILPHYRLKAIISLFFPWTFILQNYYLMKRKSTSVKQNLFKERYCRGVQVEF